MAALQFLSKYRETGLLLIRASLGLIFIILIAPILWSGQGSWKHFGSAMRHLDFHSHYKFWGFVGAIVGCARRCADDSRFIFPDRSPVCARRHARSPGRGLAYPRRISRPAAGIRDVDSVGSLLFIGPGKYSVDKN